MGNRNVLPRQGKKSTLEISSDGASWNRLVGISSIDESGGEAQTTSTDYLDETVNVTGNPGVPTFSVTIDAAATTHAGWADFIAAGESGETRNFRITLGVASELAEGVAVKSLAAVSDQGVVTFSGTEKVDLDESKYAPGMVLKIGGNDYVVSKINASDKCNVLPVPAAAIVATGVFTLRNPQTTREFVGSIGSFPTLSINSQQISGSCTIIPQNYSKEVLVA